LHAASDLEVKETWEQGWPSGMSEIADSADNYTFSDCFKLQTVKHWYWGLPNVCVLGW